MYWSLFGLTSFAGQIFGTLARCRPTGAGKDGKRRDVFSTERVPPGRLLQVHSEACDPTHDNLGVGACDLRLRLTPIEGPTQHAEFYIRIPFAPFDKLAMIVYNLISMPVAMDSAGLYTEDPTINPIPLGVLQTRRPTARQSTDCASQSADV